MIFYMIIASIIFFGYFFKVKKLERYIKFIFIILFIFTAFRNPLTMGTDNLSYFAFFRDRVPMLFDFSSYDYPYEIGYALLNSIVKTIYNNYNFFQIIYTLVSLTLLYKIINKINITGREKCLILFVYFTFRYYQNSMEFLRQNIAIEIIWLMLVQMEDSKKIELKNTLYCLVGYTFHKSSIFTVVCIPIINKLKKVSKIKIYMVTICLSIIFLFLPIGGINTIINQVVELGSERYSKYIIDGDIRQGLNIINYLFRFVFYSFYVYIYDKIDYKNKKTLLIISSIAVVSGSINLDIFIRFLEYMMIGIYLCATLSQRYFKGQSHHIFGLLLYIAFMIIMVRNLNSISSGTFKDYSFFFL